MKKLQAACVFHRLPFDLCQPKTIKGVTKLLGVWDYEGTYEHFKTLGAKRYMVQEHSALTAGGKDYDYSMTVSGVNKKCAIPWMVDTFKDSASIFNAFTNYLHLPPVACGKNIHTYVDYDQKGELMDYNGDLAQYHELSCVHLEPTDYHLSLSLLYLKYLQGIRFKE